MKKIIMILMVVATALSVQAQTSEQKKQLEAIEQQNKALETEYRALATGEQTAESTARMKEIEAKAEELDAQLVNIVMQIVRDNRDNETAVPYLKDLAYSLSFEQMTEVLDPTAAYYNHPDLDKMKRVYAGLQKRQPGTMFHELEMTDTDDRYAKLSDWCGKGQYVMIDFWASWCGPCRMEMPNVVAAYEKYHAKGFEIIGVSFDSKKESWVNAIQQLGMKWPQMSDLKGWKSAAAEAYGIFSIPSSVLLGPDGKIVAYDLRGDKLGQKLQEIYGF